MSEVFHLPQRDPSDIHDHLLMHPLHEIMLRADTDPDTALTTFRGYTVIVSRECPIGCMVKLTYAEVEKLREEPPII